MASSFKQDFPSQNLSNSNVISNPSDNIPQIEFGQSNTTSLKRYFNETRQGQNRFLTNFALSDNFVNKYNVGDTLNSLLEKQAQGRSDGGIEATLNKLVGKVTTSPIEMAAKSGTPITVIHNLRPNADLANRKNYEYIKQQAKSGALGAYDLTKSALVGNVLQHQKIASSDIDFLGQKVRDIYLDTQMYGSQTLSIPGFGTNSLNQKYQDIYIRSKVLKGSAEDIALDKQIKYIENAPVDSQGFKKLDPRDPALNYEAGFMISGSAIMERFSKELARDKGSISDVILVSPSADFTEASIVYAQNPEMTQDTTAGKRLEIVGKQINELSVSGADIYRATGKGRMGAEIQQQAIKYGIHIGDDYDPSKAYNPSAPHSNIYSVIRKDKDGSIRPDSLLIVTTRRQTDSNTLESGFVMRYGDVSSMYSKKLEESKNDSKLKAELYKQFGVDNDKDLQKGIEDISKGIGSQELMSSILKEVNYEFKFNKDTYGSRALGSSRILRNYTKIYKKGAIGYEYSEYETGDSLAKQPLNLDQAIFDTYITKGRIPKTTPLTTIYEAYTGEQAPTAVTEADKQITTASLGTQLNYKLGFDFYKPGLGIIGSGARLIGKTLDTLTGYHAYQREQAIIKHQQDDIKDLETGGKSSNYKAGPLEATLSLSVESVKGMTLSVLEYGALLGSTFFIKELTTYGQEFYRAEALTDKQRAPITGISSISLKFSDETVNTYRTFGAKMQEGLLQSVLDLVTPDISYKDQKLYNVIKARQKVILYGAYTLGEDGTKIKSKQTEEYIAAVKEYNIQLNQLDSAALDELPNYNPTYEKLNTGLIGEEWAAEAERRQIRDSLREQLQPAKGLLPTISEKIDSKTLIDNQTVGTNRVRNIAQHFDMLTETISIPGLNWLIKPDYNPAQVKYLEDSSLSHVYGSSILSRSIANIALATRTISDIAQDPIKHITNVQSLFDKSNALDDKYNKLLLEISHHTQSHMNKGTIDTVDTIANDGLINKVYNFADESREFQQLAASNNFFHLGNDADKVLHRRTSMVALPTKMLAVGAGLFAADFLLDQYILRTQGVTLAKQLALFKEVRKEEGQVFNFEFNATASTSVMLGAGLVGGGTVATLLPTIKREHIGKIYDDTRYYSTGELAEELEILKYNLNNKIQNNVNNQVADNASDLLKVAKLNELIESADGLKNLQKYKFTISPTRFLIGAAIGMMATKLAYTMAAGALNFTYTEPGGINSSMAAISADKLTAGLESLLNENTLLMAIGAGKVSREDIEKIRKDSSQPLYQRAVEVLGKSKVDKIFDEYAPRMEKAGSIKFATRGLYAEAEMVDAMIKKYRTPLPKKQGQYNYTFAFQSTSGFIQFASVSRYNESTGKSTLNFGVQLLPTMGIGASPVLPFGIVYMKNNKSNLKELQKEWSKKDAEQKGSRGLAAIYEMGTAVLDETLGMISYEKRNIITPGLMFLGSTSLVGALYSKSISKDVIKYTEDSSYKPFIKTVEKLAKLPRSLTGAVLALTHATVATFNEAIIASLDYLDTPMLKYAKQTGRGIGSLSQVYKTSSKVIVPFLILGAAYALTDPYEGIDPMVSNRKKESGAVFLDPLNRATAVIGLAAGTYKLSTDLGILGTKYNANLRNLPIIGTQIGKQQDVIYRELINKTNPAAADIVGDSAKRILSKAHYPNIIRVGKAKAELAALGLFTVVLTSKVLARAIGNIGGAAALEKVYNTPFAGILRVLSGVQESEFEHDITSSKSKFARRKAEYKDPNNTFLKSTVLTLSEFVQSATLGFVDIAKVTGFYKDTPNLFVPSFGPQGYSYNDETGEFKEYEQYNESGQFDITLAGSSMFKGGMDIENYQEAIKFLELDITNIKAGNFRLVTKLNKYFNTRTDRMKVQGMFTTYELNALRGKQALSLAFAIKIHKSTNISYQRPSDLLNNLIESSYRAGNIEGTFAKPNEILYDVFDTMDILNLPIFSRRYRKEAGKSSITSKVPLDVQSLIYGYTSLGASKEAVGNVGHQVAIFKLAGTGPEITKLVLDQYSNSTVLTYITAGVLGALTLVATSAIYAQTGADLLAGVLRKYTTDINLTLQVDENLTAYKEVDEMLKAYKLPKHGDFLLTSGAKSHPRTIALTPQFLKEFNNFSPNEYTDETKLKQFIKEQLKLSVSDIQDIFRKRTISVLGIDNYLTKGSAGQITPKYLFGVTSDYKKFSFKATTSNTAVVYDIFEITTNAKGKNILKLKGNQDTLIKTVISEDFANKLEIVLNKEIGSKKLGNILFGEKYSIANIVDQSQYDVVVKNYIDELVTRYNLLSQSNNINNLNLSQVVDKVNADFSRNISLVEKNIIKHKLFAEIGVEAATTPLMGTFGQLDELSKYYKFSQSRPTVNLIEETLGAGGTFAGTYLTRYRFTYGVAESLAYLYSSDQYNKQRAAESLVTNLSYEILGLLGGKLGMSITPTLTAITKNATLSNLVGAATGIGIIAGIEIFKAANVGNSRKRIKELERQALSITSKGVLLTTGLTKSILPFSEQISDSLVRSVFHPLGMKIQQKALDAYMSGSASIMVWNLLLPESMYKQLAEPVIFKSTYGDQQFEHFFMKANALQRDIYYRRKFYQEGVLRYGEGHKISTVHRNILGQATNLVDYMNQQRYGKYLPKYNISPAMKLALEKRDYYDRYYRYGSGTHKFRKSSENQIATLVNKGYSISYMAGVRANASFLTNLMLELDDFNNYLNKDSANIHKQFVNSTRLRTVLSEGKIYLGKVKKTLLNIKGIDIIGVSIRKEQVVEAVAEGTEQAITPRFSFGMTSGIFNQMKTSTDEIINGFTSPISKLFNSLNNRLFSVVNDLSRGAAYLGIGIIQTLKSAILSFDDIGKGLLNITSPAYDADIYLAEARKIEKVYRPISPKAQEGLKAIGSRVGSVTKLIARLTPSFLAIADVLTHTTTMNKFDFGFSFRYNPKVEKGKKIPEGFEVKDAFRSLSTSSMSMIVGGLMQFMGFGFISTLITSVIVTNLFSNPIADFYADKSLRERENHSGLLLGLNALGALLQIVTNLRDVSMPRLVGANLIVSNGKITPDTKLYEQIQNRAINAFGIRKHIAIYELQMLKARKKLVDTKSLGHFDSSFSYLEINIEKIANKTELLRNTLSRVKGLSGNLTEVETDKVLALIDSQAKRSAMDAFKKSNGEMSNLEYQQRYHVEVLIRMNAAQKTIRNLRTVPGVQDVQIPSILKKVIRTLEDTSIMVSREGIVVKPQKPGGGKKFFGFHYSFALHDTIMNQLQAEKDEKIKADGAANKVTDTLDSTKKAPLEEQDEETERVTIVRSSALNRTYARGQQSESLTIFFSTFKNTISDYYNVADKYYSQVDINYVSQTFKKLPGQNIPILIIDTETISTITGAIDDNAKQAFGTSEGALVSQYASLELTVASNLKAIDIDQAELTELTIKPYWDDNTRQEFLSTQQAVDKLGTINSTMEDFVDKLNKDLTKVVKGDVALVGHNIKNFDLIAIDQTLQYLERTNNSNAGFLTTIQQTRKLLDQIRDPSPNSKVVVVDTLHISRAGTATAGSVSLTEHTGVTTVSKIPTKTLINTTTTTSTKTSIPTVNLQTPEEINNRINQQQVDQARHERHSDKMSRMGIDPIADTFHYVSQDDPGSSKPFSRGRKKPLPIPEDVIRRANGGSVTPNSVEATLETANSKIPISDTKPVNNAPTTEITLNTVPSLNALSEQDQPGFSIWDDPGSIPWDHSIDDILKPKVSPTLVIADIPGIGKIPMKPDVFDKVKASVHGDMVKNHYRGPKAFQRLFIRHYYQETGVLIKAQSQAINQSVFDTTRTDSLIIEHEAKRLIVDISSFTNQVLIKDIVDAYRSKKIKFKHCANLLMQEGININNIPEYILPTLDPIHFTNFDEDLLTKIQVEKQEFSPTTEKRYHIMDTYKLHTSNSNNNNFLVSLNNIINTPLSNQNTEVQRFIYIKDKDGKKERKLVTEEQLTEINKQLKEATIGLSHDTTYRETELRRIYNEVVEPFFSESPKQQGFISKLFGNATSPKMQYITLYLPGGRKNISAIVALTQKQFKEYQKAEKSIIGINNYLHEDLNDTTKNQLIKAYEQVTGNNFRAATAKYKQVEVDIVTSIIPDTPATSIESISPAETTTEINILYNGEVHKMEVTPGQYIDIEAYIIKKVNNIPYFNKLNGVHQKVVEESFRIEAYNLIVHGNIGKISETLNLPYEITTQKVGLRTVSIGETLPTPEFLQVENSVNAVGEELNTPHVIESKPSTENPFDSPRLEVGTGGDGNGGQPPKKPTVGSLMPEGDDNINNSINDGDNSPFKLKPPTVSTTPSKKRVLPSPERENIANKEPDVFKITTSITTEEGVLTLKEGSDSDYSTRPKTKATRKLQDMLRTMFGGTIPRDIVDLPDTITATDISKFNLGQQINYILNKAHTAGIDIIGNFLSLPGFFIHGNVDLAEPDKIEKVEPVPQGTKDVLPDKIGGVVNKGFETLDIADTAASVYLISRGAWNLGRYLYLTMFESDKKTKEKDKAFKALTNHEASLFQGFIFSSTLAALGSSKLTIGTGLILGHIAGRLGIDVSFGFYGDYSKQLAERQEIGLHNLNYGAYNPGLGYLSLNDAFNSHRTGQLSKTLGALLELRVNKFQWVNGLFRVGTRGIVGGTLSYLLLEKFSPSYNKTRPELNQPLLIDFQGIKVTRNFGASVAIGGLFASNSMRKLALGKFVPIAGLTIIQNILFENFIDASDNSENDGNNIKYFAASSYITALVLKAPKISSNILLKGGIAGIATWATFSALTATDKNLQKQGSIVVSSIGVMSTYYAAKGALSLPSLSKPIKGLKTVVKLASKLTGLGISSVITGGITLFALDKINKVFFKDSETLNNKYVKTGVGAAGASIPLIIGKNKRLTTSLLKFRTSVKVNDTAITKFSIKRTFKSVKTVVENAKRSNDIFASKISKPVFMLGVVGAFTGFLLSRGYSGYIGEKDKNKIEKRNLIGFTIGGVIGGSSSLLLTEAAKTKLNVLKEKTASVFSSGSAHLNRIAAGTRLAQGRITKGLILGGIIYTAFGSRFQKPKDYGGIKLNTIQNQALGLGVSALAGEAVAFGGFPILRAMKYNSLARASGIGIGIGLLNYFNKTSANRNDSILMKSTLSAIAGSAAAFLTTDKVQRGIVKALTQEKILGLSKQAIAKVIKKGGYGVIGVLSAMALAPTMGKFAAETFDSKTSSTKKLANLSLIGALGIIGSGEYSNYRNAIEWKKANVEYKASKVDKALFTVGIGLLATSLTFQALEKNKKMTQKQKMLIAGGVGIGTTAGATYLQLGKPMLNKWVGRVGLGAAVGALTYSQLSTDLDKKTRVGVALGVTGLVSVLGMESVRNTLSKFVEPASQLSNIAMLGFNIFTFIKDSKIAGKQDKYKAERKQHRNEAASSIGFSAADLATNVATMWAGGSIFNLSLGLSGVFTGLGISLMTKAINRKNTQDIMSIHYRFSTKADIKKAAEMDTQRNFLQGAGDSLRGSAISLYGVRGNSGLLMANKVELLKGSRKIVQLRIANLRLSRSLDKILKASNILDDAGIETLVNSLPSASDIRGLKDLTKLSKIKTTVKALSTKSITKATRNSFSIITHQVSSIAKDNAEVITNQIVKINTALTTARSNLQVAQASGDVAKIAKQQKLIAQLEKTLIKTSKFQAQVSATAAETTEQAGKSLRLVRALNNPIIKGTLRFAGGVINLGVGAYDIQRANVGIKALKESRAKGQTIQHKVQDYQAVHGLKAQGIARAGIGLGALALGVTAGTAAGLASLPVLAAVGVGILTGLAVVAAQEAFIRYIADPFGRGYGAHRFDKTRQSIKEKSENAAAYGTKLDGATGISWVDRKLRQFGDNTLGRLGYAISMLSDQFSANSNPQGKEKEEVKEGNPISNFFKGLGKIFRNVFVSSATPRNIKPPKGRNSLQGKEVIVAAGFDDMGMIKSSDFTPIRKENGVSKFFRGLTSKVKKIFTSKNTITDSNRLQQQDLETSQYQGFSFLMPFGQEGTREKRDRVAYLEYQTSGAGNTKKGNILKRFFGWVSDGTKENLGRIRNAAGRAWQGAKSIGAGVGEGISNVFQTAKNLAARAANAVSSMFGGDYSGTVIGSWDIAGLPGIKQLVAQLQKYAPEYFNNTLEGYAATVLAVNTMMQEYTSMGRNGAANPNDFFTKLGGYGELGPDTMRGIGQFNLKYFNEATNTPEKYAKFYGKMLHTWTTGADSKPYTTGKTAVQSFIDAYKSGQIKTGQQLNDWMRSIGMGGGERIGGYYRNSWQGLTDVNFKNLSQLDPLLNFQVITSGVGGGGSFTGGAGPIGKLYEYRIGGQSGMDTFTFNTGEHSKDVAGPRVRAIFKKHGITGILVGGGIGLRYSDNPRGRPHQGVDFPINGPGYSPFAYAETTFKPPTGGGYGGTIEVFELDANGKRTGNSVFFAHLDGRSKKFGGKKVKYGDVVALSGNEGYSTGIHHHIEFRYYDSTGKMSRRLRISEGELISVVAAPQVQLVRKGGGVSNTSGRPLTTARGAVRPPLINARISESKTAKDWKAGNNTRLGTLYLASGHEVDDATGTPGAGGGSFNYRGRYRTMESALNLASRDLIYNYLTSMGFDVRLISPNANEITSSSSESVQKAARGRYYDRIKALEADGNQIVELHHDRYDSLGRSGVIAPIDNTKISLLDAALVASYGKYSQLIHGPSGIATTRRGLTVLELGAANAGIVQAFKKYLKGDKAEFEAFMKWHANQIGNAMIKAGASRKTSSAPSINPSGNTTASTYTPDTSVASNIKPNSVEATVQAKAELVYGLDKDINIVAMNVNNQDTVNSDGVVVKAPTNSTTVAKAPVPKVRLVETPIDTNVIAAIPSKKVTVAVTKSDGTTEVNSAVPMDVKYQEMFINSTTIYNPDYMGLDPTLDYMILSGNVFV